MGTTDEEERLRAWLAVFADKDHMNAVAQRCARYGHAGAGLVVEGVVHAAEAALRGDPAPKAQK